jgi:hypothetical protein
MKILNDIACNLNSMWNSYPLQSNETNSRFEFVKVEFTKMFEGWT